MHNGITSDLVGAPVGSVQQDGVNLALLLHVRLQVSVHQAPGDAACQLLGLQLTGVLPPHLPSSRAFSNSTGEVCTLSGINHAYLQVDSR